MPLSIITDQIHADLNTALSIIHAQGYRHVELHNVFGHSIEECTEDELNQIEALLKQYDMKVTNIASTIFFLCPLYDTDQVSLFNDEFYAIRGNADVHLSYLKKACTIAKRLRCSTVRIFPFRWPDNRKPPFGTKSDQTMILKYMQKASQIAQQEQVTLVLENCPYSHLPKGQMTLSIVQTIQSPYLRLLWDPANSYRAIKEHVPLAYQDISLQEELHAVYPYIEHIHLKDYHYDAHFDKPFIHKAIYDGDIDFDSIFSYLKEKGYQKPLSLEPEVDFDSALLCMQRLQDIWK